ncbi:2Fe-2S iron-sulfur cluster binding domain-containing protein [Labrenzia sp. DG1229]|uniref:2Fe-2S iron-sulfur cluster-binding protein n=1 Tax=Labrenzia sp. DG1229 TaxID=681847 RepID=UPI00155DB051|nr:2Fe-2S iron-sulfur cluster binding domain-containing protein [Labrenzia sp. DG1229]
MPGDVNHPFTFNLSRSGHQLEIPADKLVTDVLIESGIAIDIKCSGGICAVCKCGLVSGEVEHRGFVLSKKQREVAVIFLPIPDSGSRGCGGGGFVGGFQTFALRSLNCRSLFCVQIP